MVKATGTRRTKADDVVTREYTINLHKRLHGVGYKKRAPKAIKELKAFATNAMNTKDVRVGPKLNTYIWSKGIKSVPFRVRVAISRRRNEDDQAEEKLYSYVTWVPMTRGEFKGLDTKVVDDQ
jgi:large subunit ribosomal protein L31e